MKKQVFAVLLNVIVVITMILFSFISPYAYEWDETIKQVDHDTLLVLKTIWISLLAVTIIMPFFLKPTKKILYIWYILLIIFSIFRTFSLFLL